MSSPNPTPLVAAVVLTWNDTEMASRCIESVLANDYANTKVILVDNGSEPPGVPILGAKYPEIIGVQLDSNTGFTGGCNRGLERGLELGADYLFLLNNDTIVAPDAIRHLVEAMEAEPKAGAASALLLYPGNERRIQFFRGTVFRDTAEHRHPDDGQTWSEEFSRTVETEFIPACALVYRAETLRQTGLFDETLFTNWEDYDLHLRIVDHGWKLLAVGQAEVIHAHGQTTGRISPFITYLFTRNRLICLFRFGSLPGILLKLPHYARTLYWQMREYGFDNWPAHRAMLRGTLDFFLGIRGKGNAPAKRSD